MYTYWLEDNIYLHLVKCGKILRKLSYEAVASYRFTPSEIDVLMFLANNAPLDTARDVSRFKGVSKSLVCRAVESLTARGLLKAEVDRNDRRCVHLRLTEEASPAVERLRACRAEFEARLLDGISAEERAAVEATNAKIAENMKKLQNEVQCDGE